MVFLETSLAEPKATSAPLLFTSPFTPLVSFLTMPSFHSCILETSTFRPSTSMPMWAALRTLWTRPEAAISALDGMQPQLRQTPPQYSFSTQRVLIPSWPSRMAATYPPGPAPITIAS